MTKFPKVIIVMGVSGCGKSTVGEDLSKRLDYSFFDADDFHSESSITKMKLGIPLEDEDRWEWLLNLQTLIKIHSENGVVLACSALKEKYRKLLTPSPEDCCYIYLKGTYEMIWGRIKQRDHFMPASLLKTQFEALEDPSDAVVIGIDNPVDWVVREALSKLSASR